MPGQAEDHLCPDLRAEPLSLRERGPVRAVVRLEPLEIVDLIPLVLDVSIRVGDLEKC